MLETIGYRILQLMTSAILKQGILQLAHTVVHERAKGMIQVLHTRYCYAGNTLYVEKNMSPVQRCKVTECKEQRTNWQSTSIHGI